MTLSHHAVEANPTLCDSDGLEKHQLGSTGLRRGISCYYIGRDLSVPHKTEPDKAITEVQCGRGEGESNRTLA